MIDVFYAAQVWIDIVQSPHYANQTTVADPNHTNITNQFQQKTISNNTSKNFIYF